MVSVSLITRWNELPGPISSSREVTSLARSSDFGVKMTNAANYFHALRRQIRRNFRKPLVIFTPKSLLRAKEVTSRLDEMGPGSSFHRVINETETIAANDKVRRVVLCSGKIYFDLVKARAEKSDDRVALVRVEQLYPFPFN